MYVMWVNDTNTYTPLVDTDLPNFGSRFYIDPSITIYQNFFKHTLRSRILKRNIGYGINSETYITSLLTYNEYQNQFQTDQTTLTSGITATTLMGRTELMVVN